MLDYARLGAEFWEFAMAVAEACGHIRNRTFRRGVNDIPSA
jgi:hypothetical protein